MFDDIAARGAMDRLAKAAAEPDARQALAMVVDQFCAFWEAGRQTHLRLHAAPAADPDLDEALEARNERRRRLLWVIIGRLVDSGDIATVAAIDLVDLLQVLTSVHVYAGLASGRAPDAARNLIQTTADDALSRAQGRAQN